jgi:hypothetical protein
MQIIRIWSGLLLFIFIAELGAKGLLLLVYELRLDYYSVELCTRKEVENNSCKGMCHLSKEIKMEEEREKEQGHAFNVKYDFLFLAFAYEAKIQSLTIIEAPQRSKTLFLRCGFPISVFHPPLA